MLDPACSFVGEKQWLLFDSATLRSCIRSCYIFEFIHGEDTALRAFTFSACMHIKHNPFLIQIFLVSSFVV